MQCHESTERRAPLGGSVPKCIGARGTQRPREQGGIGLEPSVMSTVVWALALAVGFVASYVWFLAGDYEALYVSHRDLDRLQGQVEAIETRVVGDLASVQQHNRNLMDEEEELRDLSAAAARMLEMPSDRDDDEASQATRDSLPSQMQRLQQSVDALSGAPGELSSHIENLERLGKDVEQFIQRRGRGHTRGQ